MAAALPPAAGPAKRQFLRPKATARMPRSAAFLSDSGMPLSREGRRRTIRVRALRIADTRGDLPEIVVSCSASHRFGSSKTGAAWAQQNSARISGGDPWASFLTAWSRAIRPVASSAMGKARDPWNSTNLHRSEPLSAIGPGKVASGHAGDIANGARAAEVLEPGMTIGMHPAAEAGGVTLQVRALAIAAGRTFVLGVWSRRRDVAPARQGHRARPCGRHRLETWFAIHPIRRRPRLTPGPLRPSTAWP